MIRRRSDRPRHGCDPTTGLGAPMSAVAALRGPSSSRLAGIAAACLCSLAIIAAAPPVPSMPSPHPDWVPSFDAVDADHDGTIDRDEFAAWFSTDDPDVDLFAFFDTDGSGHITRDEFDQMSFDPEPPVSEARGAIDTSAGTERRF